MYNFVCTLNCRSVNYIHTWTDFANLLWYFSCWNLLKSVYYPSCKHAKNELFWKSMNIQGFQKRERNRECTGMSHHKEGVTNPQAPPPLWTGGNSDILAVDSHSLRWGFTHWTTADVFSDLLIGHRHHGNGCCCGQPVGLVITAGVVAEFSGCAVKEGNGAETR